MWVPDVTCKDKGCAGKDKYNSKLSSTYKSNGYPIQISYGTGSMTGVLDVDDFHLAGIKISQGTFGAATSLADFFAGQPMDGILGTLAYLAHYHYHHQSCSTQHTSLGTRSPNFRPSLTLPFALLIK